MTLLGRERKEVNHYRSLFLYLYWTYNIIVGILDGGQCEHTDQRYRCGHWRQRGDGRNQLQHQQAEEIEVRQALELLQQIEGQKRKQRIL